MINYLLAFIVLTVTAQAESSISTVVQSKTASPEIAVAPSLTPTFRDPHAPKPQKCPGYKATNVERDLKGIKADLTIAGPNCQAFGNDIRDLVLEVQYQTKERLNVKIFPKYLSEQNRTQYILPDSLVFEPAENIHDFHLGQNFTQTFWTNDAGIEHGNPIDGNIYGVHPFYQESRYHKGSNTTSHGVYARNAHGQEWLLRTGTLTYRTIGGSFDLYFLSGQNKQGGSTAIETMRQYHAGCVGLPAMQMFWTLGFHQCRLGYDTLDKIEAVVENYRATDIPLEAIWSDFDMFDGFRSFANNPVTFPPDRMAKWVDWLHKNEQYYVPLVWANIYRPNPDDPKDSYGPYERGAKLKAFIRDPESGDFYTGNNWPGFVVWGNFMLPETHKWWAGELKIWFDSVPYDGMLSDLTEPASYCVGPCGNSRLDMNPVHVPFLIPGEKLRMFYDMFLSISHALTHMMAGIPMFGVDICGYSHNASFDLCARWMSLGAFMPFYRNHNMGGTISQEAFVWSSMAEASRRAIAIRYSLLNYIYTLFHYANTQGDLVMRALAWEFPNDETLKATYSQFLLGPSLLVTPVLTPNSKTVRGVFPGIGEGTRWYDWYTLNEFHAKPQENVTLDAPLEHINLHIRGGTIFTLQKPGNTTAATRRNPFSLILALDDNEYAEGSVYFDDGVSLEPEVTKIVAYTFSKGILSAKAKGDYKVKPSLVNITVAGLRKAPKGVDFRSDQWKQKGLLPKLVYNNGTAYVTELEQFTQNGSFEDDFQVTFKY
ncbi:alpha-glucosidase precursor (maltase) [Fusarium coicis]|nr:alpha-glucosidase precursor (maltase) [Fusarium coicis]